MNGQTNPRRVLRNFHILTKVAKVTWTFRVPKLSVFRLLLCESPCHQVTTLTCACLSALLISHLEVASLARVLITRQPTTQRRRPRPPLINNRLSTASALRPDPSSVIFARLSQCAHNLRHDRARIQRPSSRRGNVVPSMGPPYYTALMLIFVKYCRNVCSSILNTCW